MIKHFGIKIIMNEEKIINENKYDLDLIYKEIDRLAEFAGMKKIDKYNYISKNDSPSELGCFAWTNLKKHDWFINNVKEWLWLDKEHGVTNIIEFLESKKMLNQKNKIKLNQLEIFKDKVSFDIHNGWTDLIYELGNNITELCKLTNCELPHMQQIKTKFGTLRFYCNTSNSEYPKVVKKSINLLIHNAQEESKTICEYCGKRGELRVLGGFWFNSCEEHNKDGSLTGEEWKELMKKEK